MGNAKNTSFLLSGLSYLFVFIIGSIPIYGFAQISEGQRIQIDALFQEWDLNDHPGGVVGIMKSDEIIYLKSFGNASLEYNIPNTEKTLFNIGSISKQFTAMGIVVLHQRGLLSIDDPVQKYFPEWPVFGKDITIKHLLQHTSGLRDFHDLLALAGWRGDDYRNNKDILRFVQKQSDLNFEPGETFMYSNTGYVLLAEIIEKVTHQDFKIWMKQNIFDPLQLKTTYVEDNYQRIVPNNATSYYHSHDKVFEMAQGYWAYTGAGNIHSSAGDLLMWAKNYYSPKNDWKEPFGMLQTLTRFNNGNLGNYALGVFIDEKFGTKRIQHAGVIGGFRTFLCTYPEKELSVVVLTNFSNAPFGEKADKAVAVLLSQPQQEMQSLNHSNNGKEKENPQSVTFNLKEYTGTFYSPEIETQYAFYIKKNTLKGYHVRYGEFGMEVVHKDMLKGSWPFENIKISRNQNDEVIGLYVSTGRVKNLWFKKVKSSIN